MKTVRNQVEVALLLAEINEAASREKFIRHGRPSTLHLRWAWRPLAVARAVVRASGRCACADNPVRLRAKELFDPEKLPALPRPVRRRAIPLEAQRLGLEANACQLNPVAVLINTVTIEIPPSRRRSERGARRRERQIPGAFR